MATKTRTRRAREARDVSSFSVREAKVDLESLRVEGIVLLGPGSGNPTRSGGVRSYTLDAMHAAVAEGLYDNLHAFRDHVTEAEDAETSGVRPTRSFLGAFGGARVVTLEGDETRGKIVADLDVSAKEAWFAKDAARPTVAAKLGFSHDAMIEVVDTGGGNEDVVRIKAVRSVDLVTTPATTINVFESKTRRPKAMAKRRKTTVREAAVGDKVEATNQFGEKVVGEVVAAGPALRILVGDRVHTEFEGDVTKLEVMAPPAAGDAAPAADAPATEADEEEEVEDEEVDASATEAEGDEETPADAEGDDEEPETKDEEVTEAMADKRLKNENAELRAELAKRDLDHALEALPEGAAAILRTKFEGKAPTKVEIDAAVTEVKEAARAFGLRTDDEDAAPAPPAAVTATHRAPESRRRRRSDAVRAIEAFSRTGGTSDYAKKKIAELEASTK